MNDFLIFHYILTKQLVKSPIFFPGGISSAPKRSTHQGCENPFPKQSTLLVRVSSQHQKPQPEALHKL